MNHIFTKVVPVLLIQVLLSCQSNKTNTNQPKKTERQTPVEVRKVPSNPTLKIPHNIPSLVGNWRVVSISTEIQGEGTLIDQDSLHIIEDNQIGFWYHNVFGIPRQDSTNNYSNIGGTYTYAIANCNTNSVTIKYSVTADFQGKILGEGDQHTWGKSYQTSQNDIINHVWYSVCNNHAPT